MTINLMRNNNLGMRKLKLRYKSLVYSYVRPRSKRIIVKALSNSSYKSIDQMWQVQTENQPSTYKIIDPIGSLKNWYTKANQYWNKSQATYDGVLSGYGNLSQIDIQGSQIFLKEIIREFPKLNIGDVIDCGAGIGRISKELFSRYFKHIDIIDQCEKYVQKARQILRGTPSRHFYCKGLQDFEFTQKYDIIWIQWVLSHLSDQDAIKFFIRAKLSLNQNGLIILKQNHSEKGFLVDKDDCSVIRSTEMYKDLIGKAGLKIVKEKEQINWPDDLFNVRMYALV